MIPNRTRPGWTLALAGFGLFMTALDNMVVTTALPVMRQSLHGSLSDLEWTVNAYLLSFACLLLTGAALGDRFGRRRMYCVGLAIFTGASAAAALSPSIGALIAARVVQGAGAAMVLPLTLTLVSAAFPPEKRSGAIGIWGAIGGLSAASGPVLGGAVTQSINWHWIFWINVPVGLALIPLSAVFLTESYGRRARMDLGGLAFVGTGLFGLTWGLVRGNSVGWGSGEVIGAFLAGLVLLAGFCWWERRTAEPMLPLALFGRVEFSTASAVSFFMYGSVFGALFLMTQFLQSAQHYSPLQAGVRLLPWSAAAMMVAPVAGKLADRYGNRPFMTAGMLALTVGFGWIAAIARTDLGYGELWVPLLFAGVGLALVLPTASAEVMRSVPMSDAGVASGTSGALRQLGGVFGVALLAAVFARSDVYTSPAAFTDGLRTALWVAAGLSTAGVLSALAGWPRPARASHSGGSRRSRPLHPPPATQTSTELELDLAR
ncbi:MAG TPA: MFS transporter [Streptosporangiaceae bacterium]|nr:MFS transporter [Streptosporangiaceae bacterium]